MEKTVKLTICLSPEDMVLLKSHAARSRMSRSAYLRKLIRGYISKAYPPEIFYNLMKRFGGNAGRLNGGVLESLLVLREAVTAPEKME